MCLWCSGKCYRDVGAVGRHMSDRGHQKMRFEGETLLEYADFYSFEGEELDEGNGARGFIKLSLFLVKSSLNEITTICKSLNKNIHFITILK